MNNFMKNKIQSVLSVALSVVMVLSLAYGVQIADAKDVMGAQKEDVAINDNAGDESVYVNAGKINVNEPVLVSMEEGKVYCYEFVAPEDGKYFFFTLGDTDTFGELHKNDGEDYVWVSDDDDSGLNMNFEIGRYLEKGESYIVMVTPFGEQENAETELRVMSEEDYNDFMDEYFTTYREFSVSSNAVVAEIGKTVTLSPIIRYCDYDGVDKTDELDWSKISVKWYDFNDLFNIEDQIKDIEPVGTEKEFTTPVINSKDLYAYFCEVTYGDEVYYAGYSVAAPDYTLASARAVKTLNGNNVHFEVKIDLYDVNNNEIGEDDVNAYTYEWYQYEDIDDEYVDEKYYPQEDTSINGFEVLCESNVFDVPINSGDYVCEVFQNGKYSDCAYVSSVICEEGDHYYTVTNVIPATCTTDAIAEYECSECGLCKKESVAPKLGHDYKHASGNTYICSRCNASYEKKVDPKPTTPQVYNPRTTSKVSKVELKKPTVKKKSVTIKWKKAKNAKKYKIQYSTSKKFKKSKTKTKETSKTSFKIKGLKKGKKYYVRVRGVNGKVLGKWSTVKKIKIKK